ncbi:unnamed protein product, partial [Mesorhabditis belari]|uniref:Mitochondrial inner membrane protease subunit 2 n=1 Tax=Mesorhabditis belari TaxID=2138241 RepID=A0AAF3FPZ2_9BILA
MVRRFFQVAGKVALGGCVLVTIFDKIGHPAIVCGNSMLPTLNGKSESIFERDFVWLSSLGPAYKPKPGDIITFTSPKNADQVHIKRCTAIEGGVVKPKRRDELMIIPTGTYWMESDNPHNALDSHVYGPVNRGLMHARATHVIWPPQRWQQI